MFIGFGGFKRSGKDTAAKVLTKEFGFTKIALADKVREVAYATNPIIEVDLDGWNDSYELIRLQELIDAHGWDYCKDNYPEVRRMMQAVGTEGGRNIFGENFWIDQLEDSVPDLWLKGSRYVLSDARFSNEGQWVLDWEGNNHYLYEKPKGHLFWVDRPGLTSDGHASETDELKGIADLIITNGGTLEEFEEKIRGIAQTLLS